MKIGFFGDSYVDLFDAGVHTPRYWKPWSRRLVEDNKWTCVNSGHSGSNQFHAISQWQKFIENNKSIDFAFFSFTWHDRLYSPYELNQTLFSMKAEKRTDADLSKWQDIPEGLAEKIKSAINLYYECLYSEDQSKFNFTLQLEYILNLPKQYPDIKFIFIPNTEFARDIALKNFTNGCLVNFAFETLSNIETGSPGIMPVNCDRVGHINYNNHDLLALEFRDLIINYHTYKNSIYQFDYNKFDICK